MDFGSGAGGFFDGAPRQFGGSGGGFDEYRQQGGLGDSGHNALDALGGGREGGGGGGGLRYAEESEEGDGGGGGFLVHEGGGGEGSAGFGGGVTGPMFGTGDFEGGGGFLMHGEGGGGGGLGGFSQLGGSGSLASRHQMNTFIPVKIGCVMNAFHENPNDSVIALAPPPAPPLHLIRVIGRISRLVYSGLAPGESSSSEGSAGPVIDYSSGRACFELEDGSGLVDCEWLLGDDVTPYKQRLVESLLVLNNYVRVYGQMSTLGQAVPMLRVHAVRPVLSVGDLLFHDIDCCSSYLRLKHFGQALPDPLEVSSANSSSRGGAGGSVASQYQKSTSSASSSGVFSGGGQSSSSFPPSSSSTSASSYQSRSLQQSYSPSSRGQTSAPGGGGEGGEEEQGGRGESWGGGGGGGGGGGYTSRHMMSEGSRKGDDCRWDRPPGAGGHRPGGVHSSIPGMYHGDGEDAGGGRWVG